MKTMLEMVKMVRLIAAIPERDLVAPTSCYYKSDDGLDWVRVGWSNGQDHRFEVIYFADDHAFCLSFGPDTARKRCRVVGRGNLMRLVRDGMDWLYGPMEGC